MNNGGQDIMRLYKSQNKLTDKLRRKLINMIVDLVIDRFGLYPTSFQKIVVAKAAVVLFPVYKVKDTPNGIVTIFESSFEHISNFTLFSFYFDRNYFIIP